MNGTFMVGQFDRGYVVLAGGEASDPRAPAHDFRWIAEWYRTELERAFAEGRQQGLAASVVAEATGPRESRP